MSVYEGKSLVPHIGKPTNGMIAYYVGNFAENAITQVYTEKDVL
jgi:hypothetical protein